MPGSKTAPSRSRPTSRGASAGRSAALSRPLLLLLLVLAAGCRGPDVREDLAESGFRTPQQTFLTYRAAFLADLPQLEYLCFSNQFRAANGISLLNYSEAREVLLKRQSFLRFGLGRARIIDFAQLDDRRARLRIRSESLFHKVDFLCELVREDFYEIWSGGERQQDDHLNRFSSAFTITEQGEESYAQAYVALDRPELAGRITEFRVGREWKIDFLTQLDPANDSDLHGLDPLQEEVETPGE